MEGILSYFFILKLLLFKVEVVRERCFNIFFLYWSTQVVPFGGLEWLTMGTFGNATKDMEINYMEYKIKLDETTLREQYPKNHPVLKNPCSIHKQGWTAIKTAYLDKQNVRPHLGRLKKTLLEALKLLPHSHMH